MTTRTAVAALTAALFLALTACVSSDAPDSGPRPGLVGATPAPEDEVSREAVEEALAEAGIPGEPEGAAREALLAALENAAPDVVRYEDRAVDAARNQCGSLNTGTAEPDVLAAQRFSYEDVTTTPEQGRAINAALEASGFCEV